MGAHSHRGDIAKETVAFEAVEQRARRSRGGEQVGQWRNRGVERGRILFVLETFFSKRSSPAKDNSLDPVRFL